MEMESVYDMKLKCKLKLNDTEFTHEILTRKLPLPNFVSKVIEFRLRT